jgi:hypothetical protein
MKILRSVNSGFWADEYVLDLGRDEKLLFLYFLTSPLVTLSGAYKIARRVIKQDTGFTDAELDTILQKFAADKKVFYFDGWVVLPKYLNNQKLNENMRKNAITTVMDAPDWVQGKIRKVILGSAKLRQDFANLLHLVETLSTVCEPFAQSSLKEREQESESESESEPKRADVFKPEYKPKPTEQEINSWLDSVASIVGAKNRTTLADAWKWRDAATQAIAEGRDLIKFLEIVKAEFFRNKDSLQFFSPTTCLKLLQGQGRIFIAAKSETKLTEEELAEKFAQQKPTRRHPTITM